MKMSYYQCVGNLWQAIAPVQQLLQLPKHVDRMNSAARKRLKAAPGSRWDSVNTILKCNAPAFDLLNKARTSSNVSIYNGAPTNSTQTTASGCVHVPPCVSATVVVAVAAAAVEAPCVRRHQSGSIARGFWFGLWEQDATKIWRLQMPMLEHVAHEQKSGIFASGRVQHSYAREFLRRSGNV
jgi:hypothetical protein